MRWVSVSFQQPVGRITVKQDHPFMYERLHFKGADVGIEKIILCGMSFLNLLETIYPLIT